MGKTGYISKDSRSAFYLISGAGIICFFLLAFRYGNQMYLWLIQENKDSIRFSDYFFHYAMSAKRHELYQSIGWDATGCFPPLAYCMYHLLYRISAQAGFVPRSLPEAESIPGALPLFMYYMIFTAVIFFTGISVTGSRNRKKDLLIFTLLMCSAVFMGSGYVSGNSCMLVLGLLILGLKLKDSPVPFHRETGIFLLAVCVALKLYPAVFGLLFLKEKKYKELIRLIIYSALLLFVPFLFFGGISGLKAWVRHISSTMRYSDYGRLQYFQGIYFTLIKKFTGREKSTLSMFLSFASALVLALLAWKSKNRYRTLFFLITIMVFFPANAYRYTLAYFSIPLIMYLKEEQPEKEKTHWLSWIGMILSGLLFTIPVWWTLVFPFTKTYPIYTVTSVEIYLYLVTYLLIFSVLFSEIYSWWAQGKGAKAA